LSEPETPETSKPLSDLEQKKRKRSAVSPFEVAGSWPKELAGGPEVLLTATFWLSANARGFSKDAIPLPNFFAPAFVWAEAAGPQMAISRLKCGKRYSAHVCT
jgi:hypothetical protein